MTVDENLEALGAAWSLGICRFAICANLPVSSAAGMAVAGRWQVGTEKPRLYPAKPPPDDPVAEACTAKQAQLQKFILFGSDKLPEITSNCN